MGQTEPKLYYPAMLSAIYGILMSDLDGFEPSELVLVGAMLLPLFHSIQLNQYFIILIKNQKDETSKHRNQTDFKGAPL